MSGADNKLHIRKTNRLIGYDYSKAGSYFITICTKDKLQSLGTIDVGAITNRPKALLSDYGIIAEKGIQNIPLYYPQISVDNYVIMPNHIHLLLSITAEDGRRLLTAPTNISIVVQQMKRYVTINAGVPVWQKSFHDHIVRNDRDYQRIYQYIDENPVLWQKDCYFA